MTSQITKRAALAHIAPATVKAMALTAIALSLAACRPGDEPSGHVAGWALIDTAQRHPIVVTQQPANLTVKVTRGAHGLNPHQRSHVVAFLNKYRGGDTGNGKISINVPSGSPNEVAALHAVADLREILREYNIDESRIAITPYHTDGEPQPPIRMSYARFVAEGPTCGVWPTNVAEDPRNLPYPNLGCATQRNFAAQVANPADLLGPRTMSPTVAERRDVQWEKYVKGESTITKKDQDERNQVKNAQ